MTTSVKSSTKPLDYLSHPPSPQLVEQTMVGGKHIWMCKWGHLWKNIRRKAEEGREWEELKLNLEQRFKVELFETIVSKSQQ